MINDRRGRLAVVLAAVALAQAWFARRYTSRPAGQNAALEQDLAEFLARLTALAGRVDPQKTPTPLPAAAARAAPDLESAIGSNWLNQPGVLSGWSCSLPSPSPPAAPLNGGPSRKYTTPTMRGRTPGWSSLPSLAFLFRGALWPLSFADALVGLAIPPQNQLARPCSNRLRRSLQAVTERKNWQTPAPLMPTSPSRFL